MRFAVNHVMDMIERRLTTDITLAQAVVDVDEVVRCVELDEGRQVNLVRLGMVVDALGRYLADAGAVLYPVAKRSLLSEPGFTSKERMVLSRWADDGVIEVVPETGDRIAEISDLTGFPVITVRGLNQYKSEYLWLADSPERVLRLYPKAGAAVLVPDGQDVSATPAPVVVGTASVASQTSSVVATFLSRGSSSVSTTQIARWRLAARTEPSGMGEALLSHTWRCNEPECSVFGRERANGQGVPRVVGGVACCPRHGGALTETGNRPTAFAVAVVVDDLPRLRFAVTEHQSVTVGREPTGEHDIAVAEWLHSPAAQWISAQHLRLSVRDGALVVADISKNGTTLWQRSDEHDHGHARRLVQAEQSLGEWDSAELYTGVELVIVDHRAVTTGWSMVADRLSELRSVLVDAPTVALRRPSDS